MSNININKLEKQLNNLCELDNYDAKKYIHSLVHEVSQLNYFYGNVCKGAATENKCYTVQKRPKAHQLAYFNIGRGFPKEIHDGHWCYVVKDFGVKMLVIPSTSIKELYEKCQYKMDIQIKMGDAYSNSRISFTDMRCIDIQRLDVRKPFADVLTDKEIIKNAVMQHIFES